MVQMNWLASAGETIESVYNKMLEKKERVHDDVSTEFNGEVMNTTMTLDECYKLITGLTKSELDEKNRQWHEEYIRKEEEFKQKMPQLIEDYKVKIKDYIKPEDWSYMCKMIPIRFEDIYHGMEMENLYEIAKCYNETNDKDKCKEIFDNAGHSGMSAGLTASLISRFIGKELADYIYKQ